MATKLIKINSPNVTYEADVIKSDYMYETNEVIQHPDGQIDVTPKQIRMKVTTQRNVPKVGLMMVGLGGNNGTTLTGMILANKHELSWRNRRGEQKADFFGSVAQSGTFPVGLNAAGEEIFVPVKNMIPLLDPLDLEIDGWDISSMNLGDAMERAGVFEWELQCKLRPYMENIKPRPAVFIQDFVAANQQSRADNIFSGASKWDSVTKLREDIRDFKTQKQLDKVILLWVGNTERYVDIISGLNDTWENLEAALKKDAYEISPSTLYATAAVLENCAYINGSPQNTMVPGLLELAKKMDVFVAGDDLKTGQTKLKSVLVDYLVGAGLKPESIVSYNHLGNNDGKNLSAPHTFRSKEISKRGVVDDMIASNPILFPSPTTDSPDHLVVIKYVPYVGDSKRAMDEYISRIAMGGENTLVIHNTCEDSLLAAPIMLDLVIFLELFQRMKFYIGNNPENVKFAMSQVLGYWLKAPIDTMTNSLFRQRACIENTVRAALSLPPTSHLFLNTSDGNGMMMNGGEKIMVAKNNVTNNNNGGAIVTNGNHSVNGK